MARILLIFLSLFSCQGSHTPCTITRSLNLVKRHKTDAAIPLSIGNFPRLFLEVLPLLLDCQVFSHRERDLSVHARIITRSLNLVKRHKTDAAIPLSIGNFPRLSLEVLPLLLDCQVFSHCEPDLSVHAHIITKSLILSTAARVLYRVLCSALAYSRRCAENSTVPANSAHHPSHRPPRPQDPTQMDIATPMLPSLDALPGYVRMTR